MDRKTKEYIAVCPSHCDAGFIAHATVEQEWEVNAFGEMLCCQNEDMGADLDDSRRWNCAKCGKSAKELECIGIPVKQNGLSGKLMIPLEVFDEGCVFWNDLYSSNVVSCPIDHTTSVPCANIQGGKLFRAVADQMSESRDDVTFLTEMGTDMILYLRGPRVECEGQISLSGGPTKWHIIPT